MRRRVETKDKINEAQSADAAKKRHTTTTKRLLLLFLAGRERGREEEGSSVCTEIGDESGKLSLGGRDAAMAVVELIVNRVSRGGLQVVDYKWWITSGGDDRVCLTTSPS